LDGWQDLLSISLKVLTLEEMVYYQPTTIRETLLGWKERGFNWVVGDTCSVRLACSLDINSVLVSSGKDALMQAITEAERIAAARRTEVEKTQLIKSITDFAHEGIIILDSGAIVNSFNPSAGKILSLPPDRVIGKKVDEVFPGFGIDKNLKTGERELGNLITVRDTEITANVVPIRVNGQIVKVVATFQKVPGIQRIRQKIRGDLSQSRMIAENTFQDIVGESVQMKRLKKQAEEYAQFDLPVLLCGETGTGKELFAQAMHNASPRCHKPFVPCNCAALPASLLESELFGYSEGAFTGASRGGKTGIFEQAQGGTLFLDEISEISIETQVRLLRVLAEHNVRRLGDDKLIPVDVRLILATNMDLLRMIEEKRFRQDLFYRINVLVLNLSPLRKRREDIPQLCESLVRKYSLLFGRDVKEIAAEGLTLLQKYSWPGNVRQLKNVLERSVIGTKTSAITLSAVESALKSEVGSDSLMISFLRNTPKDGSKTLTIPLDLSLEQIEKIVIDEVVADSNGSKKVAAERLGIGRATLWRKQKKHLFVAK
jgi:transcriptional regulator with PAS, ATPase and Fis domain